MSKLNIGFITGVSGTNDWMLALCSELKNRVDFEPYFIANMHRSVTFLLKHNIPKKSVDNISNGILRGEKCPIKNPNLEYLSKAEKKYGFIISDAWNISVQRFDNRYKIPRKTLLCWFEYGIRKFEAFFKKNKLDYLVSYGPASYIMVLLYQIAKYYNVKILELTFSMLPNRFTIKDSLGNNWITLESEYNKLKTRKLTKKEIKLADEVIDLVHNKPADCLRKYNEPLTSKIKKYIHYADLVIRHGARPDLRYYLWRVRAKYYNHLFEMPKKHEKFVFFPLHYQPEISTSLYGKWWENQINLIQCISKALPVDYRLYVKEHPADYGRRPFHFAKEIKKLSNVRLIHPKADARKLIRRSSLILTITGTAGWEAMLLRKPVIVFGDTFYSLLKDVTKLENIEDLPKIIKNKLDVEGDLDRLRKFLVAIVNASYPGLARLPGGCNNYSLRKENISLLVDGLVKQINRG
jgi:capsule polysaccharide modification protein KpsS